MSIYDYQYVDQDDYYAGLRGQIKRDYDKGYGRVGEDYQYGQTKLDYGISDLREDTGIGKTRLSEDHTRTVKRAGEDLSYTREGLNRSLARTAFSTFRRYVKKGSTIPTQSGLQNLAMKYTQGEDARNKMGAQRGHDRTVENADRGLSRGNEDFDRRLGRGERDYGLESDRNSTMRDRGYEDLGDQRDDRLLAGNYSYSNDYDALRAQSFDGYFRLGSPFGGNNSGGGGNYPNY